MTKRAPRNVTMDDQNSLALRFHENRPHLSAVAYRMLGSRSEADDAVQESWLRLSRADVRGVQNLADVGVITDPARLRQLTVAMA